MSACVYESWCVNWAARDKNHSETIQELIQETVRTHAETDPELTQDIFENYSNNLSESISQESPGKARQGLKALGAVQVDSEQGRKEV